SAQSRVLVVTSCCTTRSSAFATTHRCSNRRRSGYPALASKSLQDASRLPLGCGGKLPATAPVNGAFSCLTGPGLRRCILCPSQFIVQPLIEHAIGKQAAHVVVLGNEAHHQGFDTDMPVLRHAG